MSGDSQRCRKNDPSTYLMIGSVSVLLLGPHWGLVGFASSLPTNYRLALPSESMNVKLQRLIRTSNKLNTQDIAFSPSIRKMRGEVCCPTTQVGLVGGVYKWLRGR